jgi:hypothetical protein
MEVLSPAQAEPVHRAISEVEFQLRLHNSTTFPIRQALIERPLNSPFLTVGSHCDIEFATCSVPYVLAGPRDRNFSSSGMPLD